MTGVLGLCHGHLGGALAQEIAWDPTGKYRTYPEEVFSLNPGSSLLLLPQTPTQQQHMTLNARGSQVDGSEFGAFSHWGGMGGIRACVTFLLMSLFVV